jgi:hypothetical protein
MKILSQTRLACGSKESDPLFPFPPRRKLRASPRKRDFKALR